MASPFRRRLHGISGLKTEKTAKTGHEAGFFLIHAKSDRQYLRKDGGMPLLQNYQNTLSRFVGPAQIFVSGDTLQLRDYSKTDWPWSLFDPEAKKIRNETVFPTERKKAYEKGMEMAGI